MLSWFKKMLHLNYKAHMNPTFSFDNPQGPMSFGSPFATNLFLITTNTI
jgi:hypothetical protein